MDMGRLQPGISKKMGVILVPFSKRFQYLLGCSASKGPQQKLLQYLSRVGVEKIGHISSFRIVPLTGAKHLKPHPQSRILVLLRGSYQDFRQAPHPFLYGSFSLSACYTGQSHPRSLKLQEWVDKEGRCGFKVKKMIILEKSLILCLKVTVEHV